MFLTILLRRERTDKISEKEGGSECEMFEMGFKLDNIALSTIFEGTVLTVSGLKLILYYTYTMYTFTYLRQKIKL